MNLGSGPDPAPDRVLVLSPHTDDSELGAGGTIRRLLDDGCSVRYVAFSTCDNSLPDAEQGRLESEFRDVMDLVQPDDYDVLDYTVRRFHERRQDLLQDLVDIRAEYDPDLVIGPSTNDHHQDHGVVADEMIRAFKTDATILSYELPWNHVSFDTQQFVALDPADVDHKLEQLSKYRSQIEVKDRDYFDETFVRGLARVRGVQAGVQFAEAFEAVRGIA